MPATLPADTALVRFRYTKQQPARAPVPPPAGSPPGTLPIPRLPISRGTEDVEMFKLNPPAHDIAEVERQWKEVNPFDGDKEWQDASFIDNPANPPVPAPPKEEPDVDAQGVRHRAAGLEELPGTVTKTEDARQPAKGGKEDDDDSPVSDSNADDAIESIGKMRSKDRLQHIVANDKRTTVQDAAKKRMAELNG